MAGPGGAVGAVAAGAEQVHLTFGADPSTEMVVSWATPGLAEAGLVVATPVGYRQSSGPPIRKVTAGAPRLFSDARHGQLAVLHHAQLTGLWPDTAYEYTITHGSLGAGGPATGTFRTAPTGRAAFTFTSFGDQGSPDPDDDCGSPYSARTTAGVESVAPLFHLINGDLSYANMSDDRMRTWRNWFEAISPSARNRPWLPAAGNHEVEGDNGPLGYDSYQARFVLPDNGEGELARGLWYSFTVGAVRFIALNADDVCYQPSADVYLRGYSRGRQTAWLERTLKQARADPAVDWIVVFTHQAFVSSAEHQNGADLGLREEWGPLFDAYEVDLVLCGHDHHYERTHPVRGYVPGSPTRVPRPVATALDVVDTTQGTVHMLIGFGGADNPSNDALFDPPAGRVVVGTRPRSSGDGLRGVYAEEPAPWSAVRGLDHAYGFAAFDVDPGEPGGPTSIHVTVYDVTGPAPVPFDRFTLTHPGLRSN